MTRIKTIIQTLFFLCFPLFTIAQSTGVIFGGTAEKLYQRYTIKAGKTADMHFSTDSRPFERSDMGQIGKMLDTLDINLSFVDKFNLEYLKSDNLPFSNHNMYDSKKPVLRYFYRSKANFLQVNEKDFNLFINPGLYLSSGYSSYEKETLYTNTRTVEIRGDIDGKIGFYTFIAENQMKPPHHEREFINKYRSYPGAHLTKKFKTSGFDFFHARGYITLSPIKQINVKFGQDRNFIGHGIRSLLLSDFATDYLFLKITTRVWRFNYTNLYTRFTDRYGLITGTNRSSPHPAKYMAMHYLSTQLFDNLDIGLYESVVFHDNEGTGRGFDLHYFNPVIFYRSVEHQLGDPDKMLVGINAGFIPFKDIKLYGQFMLNEFRLNDLRARNGHAANKFGYQAGIKYIDVANISNLDIQVEYNRVRPYSYTHYTINGTYPVNSYSHYNQALANPLGANFSELIINIDAQPFPRITSGLYLVSAFYGADTNNSNWGSNIFLDYNTYERELGNKVGQGVRTDLFIAEAWVSYQLRHNLFMDLDFRYRIKSNDIITEEKDIFFGAALRLNLPRRNWLF